MEEEGSNNPQCVVEKILTEVDLVEENKLKKKKKKHKSKSKSKPLAIENVFPWKVKNVEKRGKCAISTRAIKAGELVVAERAVAFAARGKHREALCHFCGVDLATSSPKKECSSCNFVIFCEKCFAAFEDQHKEFCSVYQSIDTIAKEESCDADLLRLVFHLALSKQISSSTETSVKDGTIIPAFQDALSLETHRDKVSQEWANAVANGCGKLHSIASSASQTPFLSTKDDLQLLAAMVNTNAHGMGAQGLHNTDVGFGIFPFVSKLNHSCRPNCCFASDSAVMYVRAVQDIPKASELCVSYINLYEPRSVRRAQLAATKHFKCHCDRCSEPLKLSIDRFLEGCVCHIKGCGGTLVRQAALCEDKPDSLAWECDLCSRVLDPMEPKEMMAGKLKFGTDKPWEVINLAEKRLLEAVDVYSERRHKEARRMLEKYLADFSGKLHQLHGLLFDALTPLMNCCRALGDAEEGIRICRLILQCMEKVLPGPSLELANFYFCLGEMQLERVNDFHVSPVIARRSTKLAQEAFERVKSIRQICLGSSSLPT